MPGEMPEDQGSAFFYWLKYALLVIFLLPVALLLSYQRTPEWLPGWMPSGWTSKLSLVYLTVVAVSGRIADAASTICGLRYGLMESAPGLGKYPSAARLLRLVVAQGLVIAFVAGNVPAGLYSRLFVTLIAVVSCAVTICNLSTTVLAVTAWSIHYHTARLVGEAAAFHLHPKFVKTPNEWGSLVLGLLLSLPCALLAYGNIYARLCFFLGLTGVCGLGYSAWRYQRKWAKSSARP